MYSAEQLIYAFRQLRDRKSDVETKAKEAKAGIDNQLGVVEGELKKLLINVGGENASIRTNQGTAYWSKTTGVNTDDWMLFIDYLSRLIAVKVCIVMGIEYKTDPRYEIIVGAVINSGAFAFLKKGVKKEVAEKVISECGMLPGISLYEEKNVNVRKS